MIKTLLAGTAVFLALSAPAMAEKGDFLVRVRAIVIAPDESATSPQLPGTVDIDTGVTGEIDFSYFVTNNIAFELIAATAKHDVTWTNPATAPTGDIDLGGVRHLPPTLTIQYHFTQFGAFKPYVGGGVNYTFFDADSNPGLKVDYKNGWAPAAQVGFDYFISERTFVNADVKRIWIDTDVSINGGAITANVDINPWVIGFGVGMVF
jgi:outer membrane protein